MYLRCNRRIKDGKEHRYWNIVESKRCAGGKVGSGKVVATYEYSERRWFGSLCDERQTGK